MTCATSRPPADQRSCHGSSARQLFAQHPPSVLSGWFVDEVGEGWASLARIEDAGIAVATSRTRTPRAAFRPVEFAT